MVTKNEIDVGWKVSLGAPEIRRSSEQWLAWLPPSKLLRFPS